MRVWLLGGIDPTGGAGLLRDAWVAQRFAPDVTPSCGVTALTRQGHGAPARLVQFPPAGFGAALERLPAPDAVKLGLVDPAFVPGLVERLSRLSCPIVLDPVLLASDGGQLGSLSDAFTHLTRLCTVVTPNREEARAWAGPQSPDPAADTRRALGCAWVLLKDVEADARDQVCDLLIGADARHRFVRLRRPGPDPRGTGCALSTAIACALARGASVPEATAAAIAWLDDARETQVRGPDGRPHLG